LDKERGDWARSDWEKGEKELELSNLQIYAI